jgi:2-polyprenyl-3-methyl-5-hydroxy-6-metoxy-1,4-benzoquinol methylase
MTTYDDKLQQEADLWGSVDAADTTPPDWDVRKLQLHNAVLHAPNIDNLLTLVTTGTRVLELGCGSGWLSLAMAKRGANVTGLDISEKSLDVGREWYTTHREQFKGTAEFYVADLNHLQLEPETYDLIVTQGTLHHLIEIEHVVGQIYTALKVGGLFWVSDQDGNEALHTALFASALMFLLPTTIRYAEKSTALMKFGASAPSRIKASMEAEGLSPFEGAGRDHDWVKFVHEYLFVERKIVNPAVTGYLAHQIDLPREQALWVLRAIKMVDALLTKIGLLHSTGVILYGRKLE